MLGKPDIPEELLAGELRNCYRIEAPRVTFLPIGNDQHSALYRADAADRGAYFLKLRLGDFDEMAASLPALFGMRGVPGIIAPIQNKDGRTWTRCDSFVLVLYSFVEGQTAFQAPLSERNWGEFGQVLRALHDTDLPHELKSLLRRETYSPRWRDAVKALLSRELEPFDAATEEVVRVLTTRRDEILGLVDRVDDLRGRVERDESTYVVCHGDIHGNNVLVDAEGDLYIVDWDTAVLAPKERDLMFIGGGVGGIWNAEQESELFYHGYGRTRVDAATLAYYRYNRILEDIAATVDQIFSTDFSDADRAWWASLGEVQFGPGHVIDMARRADAAVG